MKTKHLLTLALVLFCVCQHAFAQMGQGKPEDITALKQRPLIVVLRETSSQKPADKAYVDEFNTTLKHAVANFWSYNQDITYMTYAEVQKLAKSKDKSHAILAFSVWQVTNYQSSSINGARYAINSWKASTISVSLIEKLNKSIILTNLPSIYPSEGDLVGAMQQMQRYMDNRLAGKSAFDVRDEIKQNSLKLQHKTLLIDKQEVANLTDNEIKEAYGLSYQLVDYSVIEKAILSKDPKYAYVQIVPISVKSKINFVHYVQDAENGEALGWSAPLAAIRGISSGARIKKNNLKDYSKFASN